MLMPQEAKTKVPGPITLEITEPYTTMQCATLKPVAAAVGGGKRHASARPRGRVRGGGGRCAPRTEGRSHVVERDATQLPR